MIIDLSEIWQLRPGFVFFFLVYMQNYNYQPDKCQDKGTRYHDQVDILVWVGKQFNCPLFSRGPLARCHDQLTVRDYRCLL